MSLELDFSAYTDIKSVIVPPDHVSPYAALRADPNRPGGYNRPQGLRSRLTRDPEYVVGADLGQSHDYTAVTVVQIVRPVAPGAKPHLRVPLVTRAPLGTTYPNIVGRIERLLSEPGLAGSAHLVVDSTGVGRPVIDMLRAGPVQPVAVTITGGDRVNGGGLSYRVPKRDLAITLQVAFQQGRLKIAAETDHADTLARELSDFRVKITAGGSDTYGAWRDGEHDDLVLALALSVWWAERVTHVRVRS